MSTKRRRQQGSRSRGAVGFGIAVVVIAAGAATWLVAARPVSTPRADTGLLAAAHQATPSPGAPVVEVFKDPNCGCCSLWVEHLQAAGFVVRTTNTADLMAVKRAHGVPAAMQTCHTALVGGYVVEGHVPAADVLALLRDRPDIVGLGVPGMPVGSPGMEVPGAGVQPYQVLTFDASGQTGVFAQHQ